MPLEKPTLCLAAGSFLGGIGAPVKLELHGKPVFLCCKGCVAKAQASPAPTLAKVEELRHAPMETDDPNHEQPKK